MKQFNWDIDKNKKLIGQRGISFEDIIFCIEKGQLLGIVEHQNKEKYNPKFCNRIWNSSQDTGHFYPQNSY